jgi:hypothetical protein
VGRDSSLFQPNLRNLQIYNATCSCIIELNANKRAVPHFRGFFSKPGFFVGFSLYIREEQRRISEAAMGAWEARSAPLDCQFAQCRAVYPRSKPSSNICLYLTTYKLGVKMRIEIIFIENNFWFGKWEEKLTFLFVISFILSNIVTIINVVQFLINRIAD